MAFDPPEEIAIDRGALTLLERVLQAAAPEEGCALLLGACEAVRPGQPALWRIRRLWPSVNAWEPAAERGQRFRIDPREQLLAQKWGRARGLAVLGSVHSHPASAPIPSAIDRALSELPTLMLIRGLAGGESALRCWWLDPPHEPRLLSWRMED